MLLAVLEKRGGLKVSACDAYLNIVGGLVAGRACRRSGGGVALASSYLDRPVPSDLVAIGEVGLTGELRSVNQLDQRCLKFSAWDSGGAWCRLIGQVPQRRRPRSDGDPARISVRRSEPRCVLRNEVYTGARPRPVVLRRQRCPTCRARRFDKRIYWCMGS